MDSWHVLSRMDSWHVPGRRMGATPIARKMKSVSDINKFWLTMGLESSREAAGNLVLMFKRLALWPKMRYTIICWYIFWYMVWLLGDTEDMAWGFKKHAVRQTIGTQGHDPRVKVTRARNREVKLMAARKPDRLLMEFYSGWQVCKCQLTMNGLRVKLMGARDQQVKMSRSNNLVQVKPASVNEKEVELGVPSTKKNIGCAIWLIGSGRFGCLLLDLFLQMAETMLEFGSSKEPNVVIKIRRQLPDFLQSVSLRHVKLEYHYAITHFMYLLLVPLILVAAAKLGRLSKEDLGQMWKNLRFNLVEVMMFSGIFVFLGTLYFMLRPRPVYLMDFACYKPDERLNCSIDVLENFVRQCGVHNETSLQFQKKVLLRSGLGDVTYVPPFVFQEEKSEPCMRQARKEAEEVMFGAIDELLQKTGIKPKDIGILIVYCSLFNPIPSLSAMIMNHYRMRDNIKSINLAGMGCSAGLISIDLAKDLLRVIPNSYALVVSMENITMNWYCGNNRSMLVTNCLFRIGGAAVLLSNRREDKKKAKYELLHAVRTHKGADDHSFQCVKQEEDDEGLVGVSLSKHLMEVAGNALKTNIITLGPLVLPISEQLEACQQDDEMCYWKDWTESLLLVCLDPSAKPEQECLENHFVEYSIQDLEAERKSERLRSWNFGRIVLLMMLLSLAALLLQQHGEQMIVIHTNDTPYDRSAAPSLVVKNEGDNKMKVYVRQLFWQKKKVDDLRIESFMWSKVLIECFMWNQIMLRCCWLMLSRKEVMQEIHVVRLIKTLITVLDAGEYLENLAQMKVYFRKGGSLWPGRKSTP